MQGVFKSLEITTITARDIDVYGSVVLFNRRLSREYIRKNLAECFVVVRKHDRKGVVHDVFVEPGEVSYWLGYLLHRDNDQPAFINHDGDRKWYQYGELRRDNDQPAIVYSNGAQVWYQHNQIHRDNDLPAIIHSNGNLYWFQHGKLHRDNDQPAVIRNGGQKEWYQHGSLHRDNDQPAVICNENDGCKEWFQHNKRHRDNNQPAFICRDGKIEFWKNDERYYPNI